MRDAFGTALLGLGASEPALVVVDADNAPATRTATFGSAYPERFLNVGCAEQNMVGVAAGIALAGHPVVASTFAIFLCGRAFEQIRNAVCQASLPVTLVGTHAGVTVGRDGPSHFAVEDVALMRALPGMHVLIASSDDQVDALLRLAVDSRSPTYLRVSRRPTPALVAPPQVAFGQAATLRVGTHVSVFACGVMVERALRAAEELLELGIDAEIVDVYCVKPLPEAAILESVKRTGGAVVAEEHSRHGGLAEGVAALLARIPARLEVVALADTFARSGDPDELLDAFGLGVADIVTAAQRLA